MTTRNHQMPSLPQLTKTFSFKRPGGGLTTYRLGLRPGGAIRPRFKSAMDNSSDKFFQIDSLHLVRITGPFDFHVITVVTL